jgi:hypothetical protein
VAAAGEGGGRSKRKADDETQRDRDDQRALLHAKSIFRGKLAGVCAWITRSSSAPATYGSCAVYYDMPSITPLGRVTSHFRLCDDPPCLPPDRARGSFRQIQQWMASLSSRSPSRSLWPGGSPTGRPWTRQLRTTLARSAAELARLDKRMLRGRRRGSIDNPNRRADSSLHPSGAATRRRGTGAVSSGSRIGSLASSR